MIIILHSVTKNHQKEKDKGGRRHTQGDTNSCLGHDTDITHKECLKMRFHNCKLSWQ